MASLDLLQIVRVPGNLQQVAPARLDRPPDKPLRVPRAQRRHRRHRRASTSPIAPIRTISTLTGARLQLAHRVRLILEPHRQPHHATGPTSRSRSIIAPLNFTASFSMVINPVAPHFLPSRPSVPYPPSHTHDDRRTPRSPPTRQPASSSIAQNPSRAQSRRTPAASPQPRPPQTAARAARSTPPRPRASSLAPGFPRVRAPYRAALPHPPASAPPESPAGSPPASSASSKSSSVTNTTSTARASPRC